MMGRETTLRRGRGYAPAPLPGGCEGASVLAVGAHLKNTVAVAKGNTILLSQHLGDLETVPAFTAFERAISNVEILFELRPAAVACDMHPDYRSTLFAQELGIPLIEVQHHHAHVVACMAENSLHGPVLGVSWDGAGYGADGTTWGGEFLAATRESFLRAAHLREFHLPGGDAAAREPRRCALGILYELYGAEAFSMRNLPCVAEFTEAELKVIHTALERDINVPRTTSAGRLFDAVAAITGLRQHSSFEGQAAMELEWAITEAPNEQTYPFSVTPGASETIVNWGPLVEAIIDSVERGLTRGEIASRFHNTLCEIIVTVARISGLREVVLSGGCFQNKYLLERAVGRLTSEGFKPFWHRRVPPNDGGISFGQAVSAAARQKAQTQREQDVE
jgi:hydrogenase maturation protein HypF